MKSKKPSGEVKPKKKKTEVSVFTPTDRMRKIVQRMALVKTPIGTITDVINEIQTGKGAPEVTEHIVGETFRIELKNALSIALSNVAAKLYELAIEQNDKGAQMFFLKHFSVKENMEALEEQNVVLMPESSSCDEWTKAQLAATKEKPEF